MVSGKIKNIAMSEDKKKSIKGLIKNIFAKKKDKDIKDKQTNVNENTKHESKQLKVETLLENFKKLEIEKKKQAEEEDELSNFTFNSAEGDELENFTFKVVEEGRAERIDSHSSQDSGFSEKGDDRCEENSKIDDDVIKDDTKEESYEKDVAEEIEKDEEVIESLQNLKIEDGKKKKSQLVPVSRGPIRSRGDYTALSHPYGVDAAESFRQINQINKHTFSGGQVIVANPLQEYDEHAVCVKKDDTSEELQNFAEGLAMHGVQIGQPFDLDIIQEYLDEKNEPDSPNILDEFIKDTSVEIQTITTIVEEPIKNENPIEQLANSNHLNYEEIANLDKLLGFHEDKLYPYIYSLPTPPSTETAHVFSPKNDQFYNNFLTPPRSETVPSPMSDSTMYPSHSDYTLSPSSDCEKYQEIPQHFEELTIVKSTSNDTEKKERERQTSTSLFSMKNFKDLQKEIAASFSKKECCRINREPCKQIFEEHLKKLKVEERRNLCLKVAAMDLKTAYGVMQHILLALARGDGDEDLHLALFALLGDRVMSQRPQLFADDFGLNLLKAAALRCPGRPLLTRYLVQCIRGALKEDASYAGRDCLFTEIDAQGDTLLTACARAGDEYADVLSELLRREHTDLPLFNVQHGNTEGYSALHVACRQHSDAAPHLHVVHVLLEHGHADIWKGDVKGSDNAVHMAVNSAHCSLQLVLLLFRHLDRKLWKKLAHATNRSSVTPLDYARCAAKSSTRANYPQEVLDFLKKCR